MKTMLHTARILELFKNNERYGIEVSQFLVNWENLLRRKEEIIQKLKKGIHFILNTYNVKVLFGRAIVSERGVIYDNNEMRGIEY